MLLALLCFGALATMAVLTDGNMSATRGPIHPGPLPFHSIAFGFSLAFVLVALAASGLIDIERVRAEAGEVIAVFDGGGGEFESR